VVGNHPRRKLNLERKEIQGSLLNHSDLKRLQQKKETIKRYQLSMMS
jgi:uncharacterized protein (DUF2225 family)